MRLLSQREAGKVKGGLSLDTREAILRGGGRGPALIPGKSEQSLLLKAVRRGDDDIELPPMESDRLTSAQIAPLLHATVATLAAEIAALPDELLRWHPAPDEWCVKDVDRKSTRLNSSH